MKRVFAVFALALAMVIAASAAPVNCPVDTTVAALISFNSGGGCTIQDKIFSNFQYTGGGSVAAGQIDTTLVFTAGATSDIHGWVFAPVGGGWTTAFTLSYDIAVAPGNSTTIIEAKDQINSGLVPNGVRVVDTQTPGSILSASAGQETVFSPVAGATTLHTSSSATFSAPGDVLVSYEQDWFEKAGTSGGGGGAVPEPLSLSLIGGGLLFLGMRRYRKT